MRAIWVAEHSSWPAPRRKRAAGPSTGAPPMIGVTATQSARRAATAARTPGTPRMVPIETTGLEGQITIASASAIACSRPGAGRAESMPSISMRVISSAAPSRTRYSWKVLAPAGVVMRVRTGSSVIGSTVASTPRRAQISAVIVVRPRPSRMRRVRWMWVARSRSPRPNHDSRP